MELEIAQPKVVDEATLQKAEAFKEQGNALYKGTS